MFKVSNLLKRIRPDNNIETAAFSDEQKKNVRNWYEERYDTIVVQRNLVFLLLLMLLLLSIILIGVITYVINLKRFDPFVIQIDDTTGLAQIVDPISTSVLNGNDALARYFIKRYVTARESYNPVDFDTEGMKTVRLLSSETIYWNYRSYLKSDDVNPSVKYGQKNTTYITVKSWSKLENQKFLLRFSVNETAGNKNTFNKIAIVNFSYVPMELTESEKDINPIGFQVIGYRVDDDNS